MIVMTLRTNLYPPTMKPNQTPPFFRHLSHLHLRIHLLGGERSLLQLDDVNQYLEEEEDFNAERENYTYIYEGELLQDELELVYK